MRAVIQRTERAKIYAEVNGVYQETGSMGNGLLILLGIEDADEVEDVDYLFRKIRDMRIFNDAEGKMNLSILDIKGSVGVVSQFTLHALTKKGNRPSFIRAARPDKAGKLYRDFILRMKSEIDNNVISGVFGAMMKIDFINDGPVTIILDSKNKEF